MNVGHAYTYSPDGHTVDTAQPGDFILVHRRGLIPWAIRLGERLRFRSGSRWSHAAFVESSSTVIEALAQGITRSSLMEYHDVEYILVHTGLIQTDSLQAVRFARACIGLEYGWLTYLGLILRMGLRIPVVINGTSSLICSALVAQTQCRSWHVFSKDPSCITPAELADEYGVPDSPEVARAAHS